MSKVILGGGITGLSTAYYLVKNLPKQHVTLVEATGRLGGWIKSNKINDNLIFEEGPRTIRPGGPGGYNTLSVIEDLNLSDQILPINASHPAATNRMIYVKNELHSLPSSLTSLFTTQPPFTKPLVVHLMKDLFAAKKIVKDESIYDFINRRFGSEVADYLISPLICGICAGDAKEISVKFLADTLFQYEQKYGSISRGIVRNVLKRKSKKVPLHGLPLVAKNEKWRVYSFKNGMETLPAALSSYIQQKGVDVMLNCRCNELEFTHNGVVLHFNGEKRLKSDHIVSTIPAKSLSTILQKQHPVLADLLGNIKSTTVGVVNLSYNGNLIKRPGFGFLVPPIENIPILGVIYDSCSFPKSGDTVLTVMMGGRWFEQLFGKNPSDEDLLRTAKEQLTNILGIRQEPAHVKVNILRNCIPHYVVGHNEIVDNIRDYIRLNKLPLSVCGASYDGVGLNDTIMSAKRTVDNLLLSE